MLSLKNFKGTSFSVFQGSEVFKLSNVVGGARVQVSKDKARGGQGSTDTAEATPGPGGEGPGSADEPNTTGGKWDNKEWTANPN